MRLAGSQSSKNSGFSRYDDVSSANASVMTGEGEAAASERREADDHRDDRADDAADEQRDAEVPALRSR